MSLASQSQEQLLLLFHVGVGLAHRPPLLHVPHYAALRGRWPRRSVTHVLHVILGFKELFQFYLN